MAPSAVIAGRPALGACALAHGLKLLGARIAAIGFALGQQLLGHFAMALRPRELVDRLPVPIEPEPAQAVEDGQDRTLGGARLVGILDAKQHLAALGPRIEPIEQCRARAADMEITCRRRRKSRDDFFAHGRSGAVLMQV